MAIALGSNVGDRISHLQSAVDTIGKEIKLESASGVYETAPMYVVDQSAFLNAVVTANTDLGPLDLLIKLKAIEAAMGRVMREVNGPREIDLDLVLYGSWRYRHLGEPGLHVPHPKLHERRFVLSPLCDVARDQLVPGLGTVWELLQKTNHHAENVVRVTDAVLHI